MWSITDACVMTATIRIARRQVGQASGSTSKICCRSAAHPQAIGIPAVVPRGDVALVGDVDEHAGQELERVHNLRSRRRALGLVRPVRHGLGGAVMREPLQRDRIAGAVPGEPGGEGAIVLGDPDGRMNMEPRVRPREQARRLVLVEEFAAHEEPEHGAPERLRQPRRVVGGPGDERPIRPEPAVGDEEVQVRIAAVTVRAPGCALFLNISTSLSP
jgi:hypothetical protein